MSLYFTYESRDTLKKFSLEFLFVKTTPKLTVMEHAMEFKIQILSVLVHVLHTMQNLVNPRCCFAEDRKEMYQDLERFNEQNNCCARAL